MRRKEIRKTERTKKNITFWSQLCLVTVSYVLCTEREKVDYHVLVSALFGSCFVRPVCWWSVAAAPEAMIIAVESMFAPVFGILSAVLTVIWLSRIFNDATLEITIVLSVVHLSYYICEFGPWASLGSTACYTHEKSRLISVAWCVSLGRSASCYTCDSGRLGFTGLVCFTEEISILLHL